MDERESGQMVLEKGPILMHIYDKQCEIMQNKNQWKSLNDQCFYNETPGALC